MSYFKYICCGIIFYCNHLMLHAQANGPTTKNPFSIIGTIGTSATFYSSNENIYTRPSYSWNVNGNLLAKINQLSIPLSFVVNQYGNGHRSAFYQFGASPTYKWAKLHLGDRYMAFSPLTFEGQSFKGVGLELNPKLFRFAAFYGKLNKAINEDTTRDNFRVPQFSRTAYGVKAGYGNASNFIDLIYFHAKDDSSSARLLGNKTLIQAQENAVVATTFRLSALKNFILTGDFAVSGLIADQQAKTTLDTLHHGLRNFINNFLPGDDAVSASYALQSSLNYYNRVYNSNIVFRRVQANFRSMGTPYILNDIELWTWTNSVSFLKGLLSLNSNVSQQHDNLNKRNPTQLTTQVGNLNLNAVVSHRLNLNINLSGYNLKQKNGNPDIADSLKIPDSLFLNQRITQVSFSPGYNITKGNIIHYINGNLNLSVLKDKNTTTASFSNSNNVSSSLTYSIAFIKKFVSLSVNATYNKYKQESNSYTSTGPTLGMSAQLLKNKRLNIQGNIGCLFNNFNSGTKQKNLTYSINSGYQGKHHSFGLHANYIHTQPNNNIINAINKTFPYAVATKNFDGGISYNYTF